MLRGLYLSPNFDFLRIQVKECVQSELNESNPNWKATCANKEIVQQFLQQNGNFRVSLYHNNFLISPDKKESYAEAYLNEDLSFLFIPNQMFKSVDVFFRDYNIQTTTYGLFTSSVNKESFIVQEYKDFTESTVLGRKDEIYTELFLRRSPFTQNFKRQHETFIQFLSSFGGFINILVTCIGLFMRKYNYFQFTVELANKLYNFKFFNFNKKNSLVESENVSNTNTFNQNTQTKQDTLKCSVAKLTHSKINPNIVNNVNQVESPSKLSHKSSRAVEDIYKIVESPQISFQKAPSSNDITKSNNFLSVKSPQLTSINKINNQKYQQHASFNRLFLREINERNQVTVQSTRKKIWKVVKLINSPGFNYQEYEKKKTKSFITSAIKLREQLQNYKQLGYQNKADFLFNSFKQLIRQQQQKISVSFSYFFRFFRFNYSQNMMLLKARSNVSQDLDIYTILQKLQEVEKIKRILFNKEQNILFSFCPKPVIQYIPPISSQSTTPLSQPASQDTQNQQNQNLFQKNADFDDIDTYQVINILFQK